MFHFRFSLAESLPAKNAQVGYCELTAPVDLLVDLKRVEVNNEAKTSPQALERSRLPAFGFGV